MDLFGSTRASVQRDHALITPDTHVVAPLAEWENSAAIVHISPAMGAQFVQYTALLEPAGVGGPPAPGVERFFYVLEGPVQLETEAATQATLQTGGYGWIPSDTAHRIASDAGARLIVFEREYRSLPGGRAPKIVIGHADDIQDTPFMGDPNARLKTLLPEDPAFDMAMNIFSYQPGATLPQVEIHVMEHGLFMLSGAGVYRLGDRWYPVRTGDVVWMAPFCPQWFVAMGTVPARYIYYKDVHRNPLDA